MIPPAPAKKVDARRVSVVVDRNSRLGNSLNQNSATNPKRSPNKPVKRPSPNGDLNMKSTSSSISNPEPSPMGDIKGAAGSTARDPNPSKEMINGRVSSTNTQKNADVDVDAKPQTQPRKLKIVSADLEKRNRIVPPPSPISKKISPIETKQNDKPTPQKKFEIQSRSTTKKDIYQNGSISMKNGKKLLNSDKSEEEYSSSQDSSKRKSNGRHADSKRQRNDYAKDRDNKRKAEDCLEAEQKKLEKPKENSPKKSELQPKKIAPVVYRPPLKPAAKLPSFDLDALCEVKQDTIDDVPRSTAEKQKLKHQHTPKQEEKVQEYIPRVTLSIDI
jgi:hypothetical protein